MAAAPPTHAATRNSNPSVRSLSQTRSPTSRGDRILGIVCLLLRGVVRAVRVVTRTNVHDHGPPAARHHQGGGVETTVAQSAVTPSFNLGMGNTQGTLTTRLVIEVGATVLLLHPTHKVGRLRKGN